MRIAFPTRTRPADGLLHGTCAPLPEVSAAAPSRAELRAAMRAGLADALAARMKAHEDIPRPQRASVQALLEPPVLLAAKLALYQAMRDQRMSNVALGSRLNTAEGTVRRLLDPRHRSHIAQVEAALDALGMRLLVEAHPA